MCTFQSAFDDLEREVKAIAEAAGYDPRTLILKATLSPHEGWAFEALASKDGPLRKPLAKHTGTADDFVRQLRRCIETVQPQLQLT